MRHEMNRSQSKDRNIGSYIIKKNYFSSCDDKKYIIKDRYIKQSYFHKSTC